MKKRPYKYIFFWITCLLVLQSCSSTKLYDRIYVNDPDMEMGDDSGKNFQNYVHKIREGATPAGSSKSSGGCGCN